MPNEIVLSLALLIAITLWLALKHAVATHQTDRQREIASKGATCQGRVVGIQRPFALDDCTRLYFDFTPDGMSEPLRACHIDRRPADEPHASLPPMGATVTVRYLPERPQQAVIGKLIY